MAKQKTYLQRYEKASISLAFLLLVMFWQCAIAEVVTTSAVKDGKPYTPAFTHLPYASLNAKKGGVLSMARIGTFDSLNPFIDKGVAAAGSFYLYDTLMTSSLDEVGVSYAQLASKVSYDTQDPSWVIYHINPKARFWDGSAVLADDVKATFEAILTKGLVSWRSYLADIDKVEVLDKHQVKFYFKSSDNKDAPMLVGQMPIFAKKSIETNFEKAGFEPLLGSGAYQIDHINRGRSITYKRNPNYWGVDVMANIGRFNFDKLHYVYYGSDDTAFLGFSAGEYNYHIENNARRWAMGYHFVRIKKGEIVRRHFYHANPIPMKALVMNIRQPLFADIKVRQALNLAFDFKWSNQAFLYGQYEQLSSYFHGSPLHAKGVPNDKEHHVLQNLPLNTDEKSALIATPSPYLGDGTGYNRLGLLQARKLLLASGLYYQQGKLYQSNGKPARFEILVSDDSENRLLLSYMHHLKRLGFDVSLRQMDKTQYAARVRTFDYDMIIDTFYQGSSPGIEQSYLWGSQSANTQGGQNTIGIQSRAVDMLINQLIYADSYADTLLYSNVLDRLLQAGFYVVPLYGKGSVNVAHHHRYRHSPYLPKYAIAMDYWWWE